MAQSSGPISQGTTADRQMTDVLWRDLFGDEPGVYGDTDGSAYAFYGPPDSDVATVGSATIASLARVAGFSHRIPAGSPEPINIPVASGSPRTDLIVLRYDPAFTGQPGPVRLTRIVGTSASIPTYDATPPGVEDLPLYAVTRSPGQSLSQATVVPMFPRIAPALTLPTGAALPTNSPLGTVLTQGIEEYRRELVSGSPAWVRQKKAQGFLASVVPSGFCGTDNARFNLGTTSAVTLTSTRRIKATLCMNLYAAPLQTAAVYVAAFAGAARTLVASRNVRIGGSAYSDLAPADASGSIVLAAGTYTFRIEGSSNVATGASPEAAGVAYVDAAGTPNLIIEDIGPA